MLNVNNVNCQPIKDNIPSVNSKNQNVNFNGSLDDFEVDEFKSQTADVKELKMLSQSEDTPGVLKGALNLAFVAGLSALSYGTFKAFLPKAVSTVKGAFDKVKPKNADEIAEKSIETGKKIFDEASKPLKLLSGFISKKYQGLKAALKPESKVKKALDKVEGFVANKVAPVITSIKEKIAKLVTKENVTKAAEETGAVATAAATGVEALDEVSEHKED